MANSADIGQKIKELRESRGMPKSELARRAGTTRNTLYRIESGRTAPSATMVEQIARGLDVDPGDLYPKAQDLRGPDPAVWGLDKDRPQPSQPLPGGTAHQRRASDGIAVDDEVKVTITVSEQYLDELIERLSNHQLDAAEFKRKLLAA